MATATSPSIATPKNPRVLPRARAPFKSNDGRLTVEEWAKLPETKPHYELIDGILKQKMLATVAQSYASSRLSFELAKWSNERKYDFLMGDFGIKADNFHVLLSDMMLLAPDTRVAPDDFYAGTEELAGLRLELARLWMPTRKGK